MKTLLIALIFNIISYSLIWWYGKTTGDVQTLKDSFLAIFNPKSLLIIILGNMFFGGAVFLYFQKTEYAIPIILAIGSIVSFLLGLFFQNIEVNYLNISGLLLTVMGILLMFK